MKRIALIPGDGIGKEVMKATHRVLSEFGKKYSFVWLDAGFNTFLKEGTSLPAATVQSMKSVDGAIFGAVSSPSHKVKGYSSPIVALRKHMDLYANVRPIKGTHPYFGAVDMLIIRENTECLYVKKEHEKQDSVKGRVAVAERVITEYASRRIAKLSIAYAIERFKQYNLKPKLTCVHKSNVLSITDGLFRECVLDEVKTFNEKQKSDGDVLIELDEQLVDSMVYKLFTVPRNYNVIVAPNLYGDILSDAAAALVGSLGLVPGANVGDNFVMAEPVHGSAPDIEGKDLANPIACIKSAVMLLEKLGEVEDAKKIHNAVEKFLSGNKNLFTRDMGGNGTTSKVTDAIIQNIKSQ